MGPGEKQKLISALTDFVDSKSKQIGGLICKVKEVNQTDYTCYCEPIGDYADVQQVKIKLAADKFGFFVIPKLESLVIVSFLNDGSAFISMVTEIDNLVIYIDRFNKLDVSTNGFIFNDGNLDGLVKINSLITKLNNLETLINKFVTNFNGWIPVPNDGGAALKALFTGNPVTPLTPTIKVDLENANIKQ
jgi:hypothetical protein